MAPTSVKTRPDGTRDAAPDRRRNDDMGLALDGKTLSGYFSSFFFSPGLDLGSGLGSGLGAG
jgi:hypothetical protein